MTVYTSNDNIRNGLTSGHATQRQGGTFIQSVKYWLIQFAILAGALATVYTLVVK